MRFVLLPFALRKIDKRHNKLLLPNIALVLKADLTPSLGTQNRGLKLERSDTADAFMSQRACERLKRLVSFSCSFKKCSTLITNDFEKQFSCSFIVRELLYPDNLLVYKLVSSCSFLNQNMEWISLFMITSKSTYIIILVTLLPFYSSASVTTQTGADE